MSRTRRKYIKMGICCGSNTEYYRQRRKRENAKNKQILINASKKYDGEEIDEHLYDVKLPHDSWDEPTDGTYLIDYKSAIKRFDKSFPDYLKRKLLPNLKKTKKSTNR